MPVTNYIVYLKNIRLILINIQNSISVINLLRDKIHRIISSYEYFSFDAMFFARCFSSFFNTSKGGFSVS